MPKDHYCAASFEYCCRHDVQWYVRAVTPGKITVLLLDDDDGARYLLERALRGKGFEVFGAGEAPGALSLLGSTKFDVMVCDIVMPQSVNGIAMSRAARLKQPHMKVIFMTGFDPPPNLPEGATLLRKPVDLKALVTAINAAVAA
jgi:two-component system cell cycle sensor histidine kinase/response regulator CckA